MANIGKAKNPDLGLHTGDEEGTDDEDEIEPMLKYERLSNDVTPILKRDAASCIAIHSKFLALGTQMGVVHIFDHSGNKIQDKKIMDHSAKVNQISIDDCGDYIASCSEDGKVNISGLYAADNNQVVTFDVPIKAIALDPNFSRPSSKRCYVTGDEKLIIHEKSGFLGRNKMNVIHQGEGPIRNIKWRGEFVAWANNSGVQVYDMTYRRKISRIDKFDDPEIYHCQLVWKDLRILLIGWGDTIKICNVNDRDMKETRDLPPRYMEIVSMFRTDYYISGIAPLAKNLVVLAYDKEHEHGEEGTFQANQPHLHVLEPETISYEEVSTIDALAIRSFEMYRCNNYHLEYVAEENLYFILSPQDIVRARLRDRDDHISWLMEHEKYEEAMLAASVRSEELRVHTYAEIGKAYLNYLLRVESFDEAGRLCVKILGKKKELWEEEIYKFAKIHQLKAIAPHIPRNDPRLNPIFYDMVLSEILSTDYERFYQLVKEWPSDLYDNDSIINAALGRLDKEKNPQLLVQSLGQLYVHQKAFDKALGIYLRFRLKDIFQFIHDHNLYDRIDDKIIELMDLDEERTVKMLLDNTTTVSTKKVVQLLSKDGRYLHVYLDQLVQKDLQGTQEYHGQLVKLYAEYNRPKLLPFLKKSEFYPLQMAFEECETRDFVEEQVFLLARMGNSTQALKVIMERLQNLKYAIQFCMEQADEKLWENLIYYAMDNPEHFRSAKGK